MWITQQINKGENLQSEFYGGYSGEYDVVGQSSMKEIPFVFPFGFVSKPNHSRELVFMKSNKDICFGTISKSGGEVEKGEVMIYNDFGAFLKLMADGSVNINGLVIGKDGKIVGSGGNV
ncbi:MAG: hypothetical protein RR048_03380 [Oscillospiraceae bacterium]